jgi:hypothetical protein
MKTETETASPQFSRVLRLRWRRRPGERLVVAGVANGAAWRSFRRHRSPAISAVAAR